MRLNLNGIGAGNIIFCNVENSTISNSIIMNAKNYALSFWFSCLGAGNPMFSDIV